MAQHGLRVEMNANRTAESSECLGEYLKCLNTNAHDARNKQDELEAFFSSQSYDIIGNSETL